MFPGVLAVENHEQRRVTTLSPRASAPLDQTADEVVGRIVSVATGIAEPDQIRYRMIPESAGDLSVAGLNAIRPVQCPGLFDVAVWVPGEMCLHRSRQDQLVGGHPLESSLSHQRHHGLRN